MTATLEEAPPSGTIAEAYSLTMGQYIALRAVCQQGDYQVYKLRKLPWVRMVDIQQLIDRGLLVNKFETTCGFPRVYPSNEGRGTLDHARHLLGINQL